ncbi:redoxin family protein [Yanghanlia caeni]|uniref:TlpA disulfide reductase family protein n=1 Tax=Yanghanlia caeni TaxID=3064283 RepID=A0ABU1D7P4_9BURK|nr:TlpA disulfide reductase family protein [Alcaligenaceae bacterium LG-2]NGR07630.1 TlpA family protein disulfide reductase [bacterium SGD-2]HZH56161.1 TlpA disulfide reductase family protein [Burkholderiaceae bacterium]
MKKILFAIVAIVAISALAMWRMPTDAKTAPDVTFTTITGEQVTMQELRGKVVLVKFWATSCVTCVAQMPDNIKNYNTLKDRGYDTIAVAMQYDPPNYVKNFAESRELPFKVVVDATGELARAFGDVKLTPTAFLIDKQGNIIKRYLGNYDKESFLATVNKALG